MLGYWAEKTFISFLKKGSNKVNTKNQQRDATMNEIWPWFRKLNFLVGSHHFQGSKYFLKMFLGCMEAHAGWNEMIW